MRHISLTTSLLIALLIISVYIVVQNTVFKSSVEAQVKPEITDQPSPQSNVIDIINADPNTPMPLGFDDRQLADILEKASGQAIASGLDKVTAQYYAFSTTGILYAEGGIGGGIMDPNIPIIAITMPGTGVWKGEGATFSTEPISMDGITLAYELNGTLIGTFGGYRPLPFIPDSVYEQFTAKTLSRIPTLIPRGNKQAPPGSLAIPDPANEHPKVKSRRMFGGILISVSIFSCYWGIASIPKSYHYG